MAHRKHQQESPSRGQSKGILSLKNEHGVGELAEYVITVFIVIAALSAMTTFVRRSLQARIRDARHYMISNVNSACDTNCMNAANENPVRGILQQYEPYYAQTSAMINQDNISYKRLMAANSGSSGNFMGQVNNQVQSVAGSNQLPPMNALNDIR